VVETKVGTRGKAGIHTNVGDNAVFQF